MTGRGSSPAWVAAECGASRLRLWVMGDDGSVLARRETECGSATLEQVLNDMLPKMSVAGRLPVICCGMGEDEAGYLEVPCKPPSLTEATRVPKDRFDTYLLPGLKQMRQPDVMHGEETRIAGYLTREPGFDGILFLTGGPYSKWVQISAEEVVSFRSFMTGELFGLLRSQSVLSQSLDGSDWDQDAFGEALSDAMTRPVSVAAWLFAIHADSRLSDLSPGAATARLSGLLIGLELAAARPYWLGQEVVLIGGGAIADAYRTALETQGVPVRVADAEMCTLRGLKAAYEQLKPNTG